MSGGRTGTRTLPIKSGSTPLRPWPQMHDCPNRAILDQAAAQVLRIDGRTVADWRKRIAREPTVSGKLKGKAPLFRGNRGTLESRISIEEDAAVEGRGGK